MEFKSCEFSSGAKNKSLRSWVATEPVSVKKFGNVGDFAVSGGNYFRPLGGNIDHGERRDLFWASGAIGILAVDGPQADQVDVDVRSWGILVVIIVCQVPISTASSCLIALAVRAVDDLQTDCGVHFGPREMLGD